MRYKHVILGGTFDHFHIGHKKLIDKAFRLGRRITIGISKEPLFKNKVLASTIEDYKTRKRNIVEYLRKNNWQHRVKFKPIVNFFGTTLTDKTIDAIVVSKVTKRNALIINQERKKIGFPELKIIVVDDILACDGYLLTSERIRMGEIDREGNQYQISNINPFDKLRIDAEQSRSIKYQKKRLILPEEMREELRRPLGKVIKFIKSVKFFLRPCSLPHRSFEGQAGQVKSKKIPMIISVGDIITMELLKIGVDPDVKIIDFRTRRKPIVKWEMGNGKLDDEIGSEKKVITHPTSKIQLYTSNLVLHHQNKPGTINLETALKLKTLIQKGGGWLVVDGEEDLLALPAILFAPLGSLVLYGQWNLGVVMVTVDEKVKHKAFFILSKFKAS